MVYITRHNMGADTNGLVGDIRYTVTRQPTGGQLVIEDSPVTVFSQENIDRGELVYVMTDMTRSNDSLTCLLYTSDAADE